MGRTPGKWIKNLLLGKKSAKKGSEKSASKEDSALSVLPKEFTVSSPVISAPLTAATVANDNGVESEIRAATAAAPEVPPSNDISVSAGKEDGIISLEESRDVRKLEEAATKAQSAYRGYVARRAYRTLKGIIRLQAVIRGHLVRRQAASTLLCVQGIVKLQALIRGQLVRHSEIGVEVQKIHQGDTCFKYSVVIASSQVERLPKNVFAQKLLALLPTASPLRVKYVPEDPNSFGMWLDRWTISCVWELVLQPKKKTDQKARGKKKNIQTLETEPAKPKRTVRRLSNENGPNRVTPDSEKSKRIIRKVSSHPENSVQDHQQNGVEKIKTNVRRVSDPKEISKVSGPKKVSDPKEEVSEPKEEVSGSIKKVSDPKEDVSGSKKKVSYPKKEVSGQKKKNCDLKEKVSDLSKVDKEISKHSNEAGVSPSLDDAEQCTNENSPKLQHMVVSDSNPECTELTPENETMQKLDNGSFGDMDNGKNEGQPLNEVQSSADNIISNEDQKTSQRRASLPLKLDHRENGFQTTPRVPSYMAPTESARARLKGQDSPRFARDVVDKNLLTRRHSLSSSTNTNLSILSPRAQKLVQGKGVIRTDRSLSSSRDGFDKGIQPDWRR